MKRIKIWLIPAIILMLLDCVPVLAASSVPYHTYNYDYWENIYYTPAAYIPSGNISGVNIGIGMFSNPQDIFVAEDGNVYVADTGNNRIVVFDSNMRLKRIIDSFENEGKEDTFSSPHGVFVTADNKLYVADTSNLRVVVLNEDGSLLKLISNPTSEVLASDFVFSPLKVVADYSGRVYVIAKNIFQGIMAFDDNGNFTGFTGTINVTISTYEKIWRRLSTKRQREKQIQFIPTEFTGLDIDADGFVYATNIDSNGRQSVRKLNPKGQDVIKKAARNVRGEASLSGDLFWRLQGDYSGASRIVDVVYRGYGIYSILDTTRGRIFTYDDEGNLLYIFGGRGSQEGTFKNPVAIEAVDDKILVLDAYRGEIMTFTATRYGSLINRAVCLRYEGDEASAVELWKQVLELDSNFELAYVGIGKSLLASGDNKKAMEYFKLGMDREYYSIAYKRYRDDILEDNLGYILTAIVVLTILKIVVSQARKANAGKAERRL
ncbi:gluconolactonase [Pseudoclostridium thermosuccinogenes]|uniref:gluconolactonase n=1 Tax=Clostridium thermosuccinogenes TaxID=84032 RepID=UPI002FDA4CF6